MAVTKNTRATKTNTTKANTKVAKVEEVKVTEEIQEVVKPLVKTVKTKLGRDELIECKSAIQKLTYVSKRTSEKFEWTNIGDIQDITMGELITMKSTQPRFFTEGWLIVNDEDAIEQLGLAKIYGNLFEIEDYDAFFNLGENDIERILSNVPRGLKGSIATLAREKIQSGELDSNRKIKLLEELLDVDLKIFE